jgi:hypothetical protein
MIKSRRMRWTEQVARTGRGEVHILFGWRNMREGDHLKDSGINGRIILKLIFKKWDGVWTRLLSVRTGTGGGLL